MNALVIDASVAVKLVVDEGDQRQVMSLLMYRDLLAPDFIALEVANALWVKVRAGQLTSEEASQALSFLSLARIELRPARDIATAALALAFRIGAPVYDCAYWAISEAEEVPLITADQAFVGKLRRSGATMRRVLLV